MVKLCPVSIAYSLAVGANGVITERLGFIDSIVLGLEDLQARDGMDIPSRQEIVGELQKLAAAGVSGAQDALWWLKNSEKTPQASGMPYCDN